MTNENKALTDWLSTFLKAYPEPVNKNALLPFISLDFIQGGFGEPIIQPISILTKSDFGYSQVYSYVDSINTALGDTGVLVDGTNCKLWIKKGNPFVQNKYEDNMLRAVLMNLEINYY